MSAKEEDTTTRRTPQYLPRPKKEPSLRFFENFDSMLLRLSNRSNSLIDRFFSNGNRIAGKTAAYRLGGSPTEPETWRGRSGAAPTGGTCREGIGTPLTQIGRAHV